MVGGEHEEPGHHRPSSREKPLLEQGNPTSHPAEVSVQGVEGPSRLHSCLGHVYPALPIYHRQAALTLRISHQSSRFQAQKYYRCRREERASWVWAGEGLFSERVGQWSSRDARLWVGPGAPGTAFSHAYLAWVVFFGGILTSESSA